LSPEVLGTFATVTSLIFMAMGLPVQAYKIYKAKSTKGVSLFERCTLLLTTLSWCVYAVYAFQVTNRYILIANAPGAFFVCVILYQFWIYRPKPPVDQERVSFFDWLGIPDRKKLQPTELRPLFFERYEANLKDNRDISGMTTSITDVRGRSELLRWQVSYAVKLGVISEAEARCLRTH